MRPTGQADGDVHEHLAPAGGLHECTEQYKYEDIGDGYANGRAEDPIQAVDIADDAVYAESRVPENSREVWAPDRVAEEDQRENRQRRPHRAPSKLDERETKHCARDDVRSDPEDAGPIQQTLIVQDRVQVGERARYQ